MVSRIVTYELTDEGERLVRALCKRLSVDDARIVIDRALKSLEAQVGLLGEKDEEVEIANLAGDKKVTVRIRTL